MTSWKLACNNNYRLPGWQTGWLTKRYFAMPPDGPWKSSHVDPREAGGRKWKKGRDGERKNIVLAGRTSQRVGASVVGAYGPPLLCLVKWKVISNLLLLSFATGQCKYLGCLVRGRGKGTPPTGRYKRDASFALFRSFSLSIVVHLDNLWSSPRIHLCPILP